MSADLAALLPAFVTIPVGTFRMGTAEHELSALAKAYGGTRESYREESPQHTRALPAFAIARAPVSNALFAAYAADTGARTPITWHGAPPAADLLQHPVVDISWEEATAFCAWLSAQGALPAAARLPSEAEWECAARGADGRMFPWGQQWDGQRANTRENGRGHTTAAGAYPEGASPHGCLDMAGNVWEWTASLDAPYPYDPADGREDPRAPGRRILRGGCYANPHGYARCACRFRLLPSVRNPFLGFRLAYTAS